MFFVVLIYYDGGDPIAVLLCSYFAYNALLYWYISSYLNLFHLNEHSYRFLRRCVLLRRVEYEERKRHNKKSRGGGEEEDEGRRSYYNLNYFI